MNTIDIAAALGLTERSITSNGSRSVVTVSRTYDTSVDDLWQACTDAARLSRWIGVVTGDLREGGSVSLCMSPPDRDVATLTVLRCDRPRRLAVEWAWPGEPDSVVEINLMPTADGRTTLSLEHLALTDTTRVDYGRGWDDFLLRLGALVDGGDPHALRWSDIGDAVRSHWTAVASSTPDDRRWPTVTPTTGIDSAGSGDGTVSLRARHEYAAAPADVWAAITGADRLALWMAPVTGDLRVNGAFTIAYDNGSASGTVLECEPNLRLVTSWRWAHEPDRPPSTVTVVLSDRPGGGTVVELTQERGTAPGAGYAAGWYAYLRSLDRHLAGDACAEPDWQADWTTAMAMLRS